MEFESILDELRVRRSAPTHLNYQIKKGIEDLITSGKIPAGTRMPSVQQIADACGVSLNTAKFAVRELARDGFLIPRAGLGTFVAEKRPATTEVFICDVQPEAGSSTWAFHRQINEGLVEGYSDLTRRIITVYAEDLIMEATEIVASARAKNSDCVIAYRPTGEFAEALAEAAEEINCISLVYSLPHSMAHAVLINPEPCCRNLLMKRLDAGVKSFAFISLDLSKNTPFDILHNPYHRIYRTFIKVMEEAGIEPVVCQIEGKPWDKFPGLPAFEERLTDDTTLICLPSGANGVLSERWKGLDIITYTESRTSLKKQKKENKTVMYGGLERCGLAAARLHNRILKNQSITEPIYSEVEPEVAKRCNLE